MSKLQISDDRRTERHCNTQRSHSISPQRSSRRRVGTAFSGGAAAMLKLGSTSFWHSSPLQRESRNRDESRSDMGGGSQVPNFTDRQYLNILESMGQSVHIFDPDCKIIYWNRTAEQLYGYTAAEAVGSSILDLLVEAKHIELATAIIDRNRVGESWTRQFPAKSKKGEIFNVICTNTPFYDDEVSLFGIYLCINQFKKLSRIFR